VSVTAPRAAGTNVTLRLLEVYDQSPEPPERTASRLTVCCPALTGRVTLGERPALLEGSTLEVSMWASSSPSSRMRAEKNCCSALLGL
jgi:hypothetical protein